MKDSTLRRLKWSLVILIGVPITLYIAGAVNYFTKCGAARTSCLEHRKAGCSISGDYNIKLGGYENEATCDMQTEGGGWTLVANYLHRGIGTPPVSSQLLETGVFPLQDQLILGLDERTKKSWGHVSNRVLTALPFSEVRFKCRTSAHERNLDIVISDETCLQYFRSGKGACIESADDRERVLAKSRALFGSNGRVLATADKGWRDQGDSAILNYPFFTDYRAHWSVGSVQNRFECDDYEPGGKTNTLHQVWVR